MKIHAGTLQLYSNSNRTNNLSGNNQVTKAIDQVHGLGQSSLDEAGINRRAKVFVKIGDGPRAQIKFDNSNRISVKINSVSERFRFEADDWFVSNSAYANALTLSRPRKLERSALAALGLQTGTIDPELVGTKQVKVGEEKVLVGTETVKVGTEQVFDGLDRHIVGLLGGNTRSTGSFRSGGLTPLETVNILFGQNSAVTTCAGELSLQFILVGGCGYCTEFHLCVGVLVEGSMAGLGIVGQIPYFFIMAGIVKIESGYRSKILGRVTTMHAKFYSLNYDFGMQFEIKVASEMAEFLRRIDGSANEIWAAVKDNRIVGSISIDGEDIGNGIAHLRWFVMDDEARGTGVGRQLLEAALQFVDEYGFQETHLWTFKSLDAARVLYEQSGFRLVNEEAGIQWGSEVLEQKFVRIVR
ncbi:putative HTH-type DNA-binding domain-containing acetyltransferase YbfA [Nymphon striatum]|nr:putative HTH-type DNA-binding domain-containing acetyltransferase YbfA [Nymphon striatum]